MVAAKNEYVREKLNILKQKNENRRQRNNWINIMRNRGK